LVVIVTISYTNNEITLSDSIRVGQPSLIPISIRRDEVAGLIKMKCPICGSSIGKLERMLTQRSTGNNSSRIRSEASRRLSSTLVFDVEKGRKFARGAIHVCKVCKNVQTFLVHDLDL
jgi:hypothetical protein